MPSELPVPKFQRLERVAISGDTPRAREISGERGIVAWLESAVRKHPESSDRWAYVVHVPARNVWQALFQSELESLGEFAAESALLGTRPEISFDLLFDDDRRCDFMEGCYRLPGEFWKVAIFMRCDVPEVRVEPSRWGSSIDGLVIRFPRDVRLSREDLLGLLPQAVGHRDWMEVRGPDSILLR